MKAARVILAVLAMLVVVATASAQNNDRVVRDNMCFTIDNPCCDEPVYVCVDVMMVFDKDGAFKHISYNGTGTGMATGTEYTMRAIGNMHQNDLEKGAGNAHQVVKFELVATGDSDCSFSARGVAHITWKPDGTPTAEFYDIVPECENGTVLD